MKEPMGMHTTNMPNKNGNPSKLGEMGTKIKPGMSHEEDMSRGEGIAIGSVDKAHIKAKVEGRKHVTGLTEIARANQTRLRNGNADPEGNREVAMGKSGKAMMDVENSTTGPANRAKMEKERHEDEAQNHDTFMSEL